MKIFIFTQIWNSTIYKIFMLGFEIELLIKSFGWVWYESVVFLILWLTGRTFYYIYFPISEAPVCALSFKPYFPYKQTTSEIFWSADSFSAVNNFSKTRLDHVRKTFCQYPRGLLFLPCSKNSLPRPW